MLNFIFAFTAGMATVFLGGVAFLEITGGTGPLKVAFSATAGIAVFVLCYLHPLFAMPPIENTVSQPHSIPEAQMIWTKNWELTKQTYANWVSLRGGFWGGQQQSGALSCTDRQHIDNILSSLDFDTELYLKRQRDQLISKIRSSPGRTVFDVSDCVEFYSDMSTSLDEIRQSVRQTATLNGADVAGVYEQTFRDFSGEVQGKTERDNEAWQKHLDDIN